MMTKEDLWKSDVVFDEATHTYIRGGAELSGITGLIHSVLQLGVYPDASDYVKKVQIPKAGYYGTCVHKAIQTYEELGIEMTEFPEKSHPTAGKLPAQDVFHDLQTYKMYKPRKCKTLACEFTVDYGNFASQIDQIWIDEDDKIYLVDFKTNNLDYYPGGVEGLQEYLSWQLSCYAFMFELMTGLKVKGLVGLWLRKGEGDLWRIPRQADEQVQKLLSTEIRKKEYGGFTYHNPEMQVMSVEVEEVPIITTSDALSVPTDVVTAITRLLVAEKAAKAMKDKLRELMEDAGVTKWSCNVFTATIGKSSETTTFDTKAFKADHPDLYEQYLKTTTRKGSFTTKLK